MTSLSPSDYVAIGVYMALVAGIGVVLGAWIKDVGAYFKGGGTLPWPAAAVSNYMSMFSTFIFVAYAGMAYDYGLVALTLIWCMVPPALFAAAIIAKCWRRAGIMSPVEYMETRFNAPVRQFFSWSGIAFRLMDNMVRLYAIGVFISAATPLSIDQAILMTGLVVTLYTVVGGLWAVVLSDLLQFVVLFVAVLILVPLSLHAAGGLAAMRAAVPEHFTFFQGPRGAPLFLIVYYIMVLIKYNGNWSFIQRFYSVRDEAAGRKAALAMAVLFFVSPVFFLLPAIAMRVIDPALANSEQAYVAIALRVLPPGIMGLLLAAMFAATMSAVDSDFNVTAGVFTRDVYQRLLRPVAPARELMFIGRAATLACGLVVVGGALFVGHFGGAFQANMILTGLAIPLSVPLVLGVLTRRARPWGALASVVLGCAVGFYLNWHPEVSWPVATGTVIVVSVGTLLLSGLAPSRDNAYRQRVHEFFQRLARPIPEEEKPDPDPRFEVAMRDVFALALGSTGILFAGLGLLSVSEPGGFLSVGAGIVCVALAVVVYLGARRAERLAGSAGKE
ncbi:MAG: sodium/solute symporter [Thermoguttaceae bacterium]|jgi:SSS family transporter|nr:sodium/solute symporter [Thermoguttaceae bacterium]